MKIKWLLIITILVTSCNKVKYASKPDKFLDNEKMAAVMTDMFLLDGSFAIDQYAYLQTGVIPHKFIYKKHKIDSLTFTQNFKYYIDRPELFEDVLKRTKKRLEFKKQELKEQMAIEKKEQATIPIDDSIKESAPRVLLPLDIKETETSLQTGQ